MTREELIAMVTKITELRAQVAELAAKQKELKRLESLLDTMTGLEGQPTPTRQRQGSSIEEKIGQLLEENRLKEWTSEELGAQIGAKIPTVRAALSRLRHSGKIIDARRGYVQARMPQQTETPKEADLRIVTEAA